MFSLILLVAGAAVKALGGGGEKMTQQQFDSYRQGVWDQGAAIVDEHDSGKGLLNDQISRLAALLAGFQAQYDQAVAADITSASWLKPRFHDYYDFFANILSGWRSDEAGMSEPYLPVTVGSVVVNRPTYRLILYIPDRGVYGTSGTYFAPSGPLCSPTTPGGCKGMEFPTVQAAVDWARANNEIPVYIDMDYDPGVTEAWRLAAGGTPAAPRSFIVKDVTAEGVVIPERSGVFAALGDIPPVAIGIGVIALAAMFSGKKGS